MIDSSSKYIFTERLHLLTTAYILLAFVLSVELFIGLVKVQYFKKQHKKRQLNIIFQEKIIFYRLWLIFKTLEISGLIFSVMFFECISHQIQKYTYIGINRKLVTLISLLMQTKNFFIPVINLIIVIYIIRRYLNDDKKNVSPILNQI